MNSAGAAAWKRGTGDEADEPLLEPRSECARVGDGDDGEVPWAVELNWCVVGGKTAGVDALCVNSACGSGGGGLAAADASDEISECERVY